MVEAPAHLSFEELAALPAAAGTAANALFFGPMPFKKGMTVLTQGTGGVSSAAIQVREISTPLKALPLRLTQFLTNTACLCVWGYSHCNLFE